MAYSDKFQQLADTATTQVSSVEAAEVDDLIDAGAIVLDIRDPDEHAAGHMARSMNISRGKLEMVVESKVPDLDTTDPLLLQRGQQRRAVGGNAHLDGLHECPLHQRWSQRLQRPSRHDLGGEPLMCQPATCPTCSRPTWRGCGAHVEQVLGHVQPADRCSCRSNHTTGRRR